MEKLTKLGIITLTALTLMACSTDTGTEDTEEVVVDETEEVSEVESAELVDGSYRVEESEFGETGWKEALEIDVVEGVITEARWESVNEEGENKIEDDNYQETMTNVDGLGPQDFIPALEEDLVDKQNADDVDVITGATGTAEKFKVYANQLINQAKEGNTEVHVVTASEEEVDETAEVEESDESDE